MHKICVQIELIIYIVISIYYNISVFQPLCRGALVCRDILSGVPWQIIQYGFFSTKDMQTPSPPTHHFLTSDHLYMKDAHSAESNEISNFKFFRFLCIELWSILYTKFINKKN